jgi:aminopeptidase N
MERAAGRPLVRFFEDWIYSDGIPSVSFGYKQVEDRSAVLRFEQRGSPAEFAVTVKLNYTDGESEEIVVALSERLTERTVPLKTRLRGVDVNADHAALVRIDR